jgi:hypothetical protein
MQRRMEMVTLAVIAVGIGAQIGTLVAWLTTR